MSRIGKQPIEIPPKVKVEVQGNKVSAERKFFPGYVLIKMDLNDEAWHLVKNAPKVTGFLGSHGRPTSVPTLHWWHDEPRPGARTVAVASEPLRHGERWRNVQELGMLLVHPDLEVEHRPLGVRGAGRRAPLAVGVAKSRSGESPA